MNTYNDNMNIIDELQDFMFNEENIKSYIEKRNEYREQSKLEKEKEKDYIPKPKQQLKPRIVIED